MSGRYRTLVDMFEQTCVEHARRPALGTKGGAGWTWLSYGDLHQQVDHLRGGLASLGVAAGDRVAIVSNNRVEWAATAHAAYGLGAAIVPLYENQKPDEWDFILRDSGANVALAGTSAIAASLRETQPSLPDLRAVVSVEGSNPGGPGYAELLAIGKGSPVPARQPAEDATATLIYTSGTTGKPKGVVLTHANITSNLNVVPELFDFSEEDRSLSFIPWAHAFGHTCELHTVLSLGASMGINDAVPQLPANLAEVKPTILIAVPRIFNSMFVRIHAKVAERPEAIRSLFDAAVRGVAQGLRGARPTLAERLALLVANPLIFAKVRQGLGGKLKYAISGGAALSPQVAEFMVALGIRVYEGYGLTETSPLVTANHPGHVKIGTVGQVIPGVTLKFEGRREDAESGEIVVYGPNVMKGYHNRPDEQGKAFTPDGGFRTGDLGHLDEDGFLHITGRIKEQYKLENGKYVVPVPLEEELQLSPYIATAVIHGANRPHNVALIALNVPAVEKWATEQGIPTQDLARDARVRELIAQEISARSSEYKEYEKPRDFVVTTDVFTPENELLTPSLKLRRPNVMRRYGAALEGLYRGAPG